MLGARPGSNRSLGRVGLFRNHIDSAPADIDNAYQPTLELRGDIAATLDALASLIGELRLGDDANTIVEAASEQAVIESDLVSGVLAGFLTPAFEQGVSVAGYHLHFINDDRDNGGHALDFVLTEGIIEISTSSELHVSLPRTSAFMGAALEADAHALDAQIRQAEG